MKKTFIPISLIASLVIVFLLSSDYLTVTNDVNEISFSKEVKGKKHKMESEHAKRVEEGKFDEPDKFAELHRMLRTKEGDDGPRYKSNYLMEEFKKAKLNRSKYATTTQQLEWVERGPANVGGRTRGLIVDPDDPSGDTWFAGSVGGGVWKTSDAGVSWVHLTEELPALATTVLEMAGSNHDVIYVGTGEGFNNADAVQGQGIFKTTDKGKSWFQLESTATSDFHWVNRIVVDPADENIVVAATNTGLHKSIDGGESWTTTYPSGRRCQHLIANPENFNTLYCAVNGLGVVKSKDAGDTWVEYDDFTPRSGRFEIAIAQSDTSRLYAANESSVLFMSLDAGETWQVVEEVSGSTPAWLGAQGWYDNTIAVHPYDENVVFMGGIDNWRADITVGSKLDITEIVIDDDWEDYFSYSPQGLPFKSGGVGSGEDFWDQFLFETGDLVEFELRVGPGISQMAHRFTTNDYVYQDYVEVPFQVWDTENNKQLMLSFDDIDANGEYNLRFTRGDILFVNNVEYDANNPDPNITGSNMGLQYKNIYVVALRAAVGAAWDPDTLPESFLAAETGQVPLVNKAMSAITDGYDQYGAVPAGVHVDQHNLVMIPVDEATQSFRILNANDGGVGISDDGGVTWRETDEAGYNTTQFYGIDKRNGADEYLGGTQDNGTWQSNPGESASATTNYFHRLGGDGFEVSWHYDDPQKMIGGSQYNTLYRTVNGWQNREAANIGFDDWSNSSNSPFISKVAESNADPDLVFTISTAGVWRSDNFAADWTLSPIPSEDFHNGSYFSFAQVDISIADPQVVWAGAYMSASGKIHVSKDGGLTFNATNNFKPMGLVSGISTHPHDPATAFATFSIAGEPKILKTTDYGDSWTDISGFENGAPSSRGFPDVAVYDVEVMPYDDNVIWAGTDLGLFESVDGGQTWYYADNGLPAVSIWDMRIVNDQVVLGTHGRGIYTVTLPELSGYEPPEVTLAPRINSVALGIGGISVNVALRSEYDSTRVLVQGSIAETFEANTVGTFNLIVSSSIDGEVEVQAVSYKDGRAYKSGPKSIFNTALLSPSMGYANDFGADNGDFLTENMNVATPQGFSNGALHSAHPYNNQETAIALLRVPIIVADQDAFLSYDDVAIIESGEPGTVFGDDEFWDYVIVEGYAGTEWVPLLDGYDARFDETWLNTYNTGFAGNSNMYVNHSINLLNHFSAGDTVLIRFRLFADQFTTGWGWAVDNVTIQDQFVDVKDNEQVPTVYSLNQNYPNPFNPSTKISYSVPNNSKVKLSVYTVTGELVETLVDEVKSAGQYEIEWRPNLASGVYFYRIQAEDFVASKKMLLLK